MNEDIDLMLNWKHVACLNYFRVYTDIPVSRGYFHCCAFLQFDTSFSLTFSVKAVIAISEIFLFIFLFDDWSYTRVSGACLWWVRRNFSFSFTRCQRSFFNVPIHIYGCLWVLFAFFRNNVFFFFFLNPQMSLFKLCIVNNNILFNNIKH